MEKNISYSQIYTKLTKGLSPKVKDIFDRRFGIKTPRNVKLAKDQTVPIETLESIGDDLGITRERVRQIEEAGFTFVRKHNKETLDILFAELNAYFAKHGGFKKEETVLQDLGKDKHKPYVLFLLTLGDQFARVCGKKDYHSFWVTEQTPEVKVKETLASLVADIKTHGKLLTRQELFDTIAPTYQLSEQSLASYLGVSKKIQQNREGKLGLVDWPEIKPRGIKDKTFLVLKKRQEPLHFRKIAELIDALEYNQENKKTNAQTVHNELIKDSRFVLVGRGMYALGEWGYSPGTIRDVISKLLREKPQGLLQENVIKEVLAKRLVAKNTVLVNLNNKKYFQKDDQGKYFLRETQTV